MLAAAGATLLLVSDTFGQPDELLETLTVPATRYANLQSTTTLAAGETYYILAEGTYTHHGSRGADAEWDYDGHDWYENAGVAWGPKEHDLLINDTEYDWSGSPLASPDPISQFGTFAPHTYSPSHTYWLALTGTGSPIRLSIQDVDYSDNRGSLTTHIYSAGSSVEYTLDISSTAGGTVSTPGEGAHLYPENEVVAIVASADSGYLFTHWSATAVAAGKVANVTRASTTVTVDGNYTLQANFARDIEAPAVQTQSATGISQTSATLHGTIVDDGGDACTWGFEYWEDGGTGQSAAGSGTKSSGESFALVLSDLKAGTVYHYKALATNSVGTSYGSELTFQTAEEEIVIPSVGTNTAYNVEQACATLAGHVIDDGNEPCGWGFEYWEDGGTGQSVGGSGTKSSGEPFTLTVSGLKADTVYHYKAVASNSAGTSYGLEQTFQTAVQQYTLTIASTTGGYVDAPGEGSFSYTKREEVRLEAVAYAGYDFKEWSGNFYTTQNPATITMNADYNVTANFELAQTEYTLMVNVSPADGGTVTRSPNKSTYAAGESVTLTAAPASGYTFTGWSGDLTGSTNPATIVMDSNRTVTASFATDTEATRTLTILPTSGGTVDPDVGPHAYPAGAIIAIEATSDEDCVFLRWSGTAVQADSVADPNSAQTTVVLANDLTLRAEFGRSPSEDSVTVGLLTIRGDTILQQSGSIWTIQDSVTVNEFVHVSGTVTVNTATLRVRGDGEIWLRGIPVLGDVKLYEGPWEFDGETAATTAINDFLAGLELAGMQVKCTYLGIIDTTVKVQGYIQLPEYAGGGKIDIAGDHYLQVSPEKGLEYDLTLEQTLDVNVAGILFKSENSYVHLSNTDADQISVYGAFTLDGLSPHLGQVSVNLDPKEGKFLRLRHDAGEITAQLVGRITIAKIVIVPKKVYAEDIIVDIDTVDNNYYGSGALFFPMGTTQVGLDCELGIVGGYFDSGGVEASFDPAVCVLYGPGGVPVVYLMSVGGGVHNMSPVNPKPIVVEASSGFQGGPEFFGSRLITLELIGKVDLSGSVQGTAIVHILTIGEDSSAITGEATVTVTAGQGATLDGSLEAALGADPFLFVAGSGSLDMGGNVGGSFDGKLVYPEGWPFGAQLKGIEFPASCHLQAINDDSTDNDYVLGSAEKLVELEFLGWHETFRVEVGFKFFFAANEWEYWVDIERVEEKRQSLFAASLGGTPDDGFLTAANAPTGPQSAIFYARWETSMTNLYLITPQGETITPGTVEDYPNISYYASATTMEAFYRVKSPIVGVWEMALSNAESVGEYTLQQFWASSPPAIEILEPSVDVAASPHVLISWDDGDSDDDARISLYYDTDRQGANGTLIVADLGEDDPDNSYLWDTENVPTGNYYVYAVISDERHVPRVSYSTGRVQVVPPSAPAPPHDLAATLTAQTGEILLTWAPSADPNVESYNVSYASDAASDGPGEVLGAGGNNELVLGDLVPGETYRIAVASVDANGLAGLPSDPIFVSLKHEGNHIPVFTGAVLSTAVIRSPYGHYVLAEDVDGDTITYALVRGDPNAPDPPDGLTMSSDGLLSWMPEPNQVGLHNFLVRLEDGKLGVNEQRFKVRVVADSGTNHAPEILSEAPPVAIPGSLYAYQLVAEDPDLGDEFSFELLACPAGAAVDDKGLVQWLVPEDSGQYECLVKVTDSQGAFSLHRFTVYVDLRAPYLQEAWAEVVCPTCDAIEITARPVHDTFGPVEYRFEVDGELNSWQTSPKYAKTGLLPNTRHEIRARVRDASPSQNVSDWSDPVHVWTLADVPLAPILVASDFNVVEIRLDAGDSPDSTALALYNRSNDSWVGFSGLPTAQPTWASAVTWDRIRVQRLAVDTTYHLQCRAKNGDGVESAFGPVLAVRTLAPEARVDLDASSAVIHAGSSDPNLGTVTVSATFANDPFSNSAYKYLWKSPVNHETGESLALLKDGGEDDASATYEVSGESHAAPATYAIQCTVVGRDVGNSVSNTLYVEVVKGPEERLPIAHWAFDEGAGTVAHDSQGAFDAGMMGVSWTDGVIGAALWFDGADDHVDCGSAEALAPEKLTLAFWIFPEYSMTDQYVVGKAQGTDYARDYTLCYRQSGYPEFYFSHAYGEQVRVKSASPAASGQWVHVVAVRDGSQARLYVNGVLQGSQAYSFVPVNKRQPLTLGGLHPSLRMAFFRGKIDDVRLYDQPLSAEEIEELYLEASP